VDLKRLDILGFKSFAHKTTIKFADGVTAIVGPNGCGKTNVLDSLRWVLGEQRPSLLRGGKMEEIIFNGTRDLKPLGMAEVTLTVVNSRGLLPTEYHEVQITRRLFRSGESEYLLNKVPCRLKDITDLFADTGMGAHSYSVIQQDMIDAVISDKAEERRFLFEEAAGITKYKQRKKAALRKLEATENDFLRLRDIYSEVKTQVNSLYRQHKKAERYQRIADEIKQWDVYINSRRFSTIELEKRELRAECDSVLDQRSQKNAELDQFASQVESGRSELLDIERNLSALASQMYAESEQAHGLEKQISVMREKAANGKSLIEKNTAEIAVLAGRVGSLDEQIIETRKDLSEQQALLERANTELAESETTQSEADQRLLNGRAARDEENRRLIELEGKLSSGKTEEKSLREQESEYLDQLSRVEKQIQDNSPRQQELLSQIEASQHMTGELLARKSETERRQTELTMQMEATVEMIEELSLEISSLTASIEACEARRNLLKDMMVHYEGHESGLVAAMETRERWPGIAGTVAEKFVPVEGLEVALEAALGGLAGFMICYDRSTAENVIAWLKTEKKGKVGILVPDSGTLTPAIRRPEIPLENFVGWLEALVSTDAELRPLMDAVLSRVAVFKAGSDPKVILERLPYGFSAVSTDGVFYSKNVITGGSDDRFPLFRRKEKVEEQELLIREHSRDLNTVKDKKNHASAQLAAQRAESGAVAAALETLGEEIDSAQRASSEIDYQRRTMAAEFDRLDKERYNLQARLENIRSRQYSLGLDSDKLAGLKESLVSTMQSVSGNLGELERAALEALERVARLQVAVVEARSRTEQTESRIGHLIEIKKDIEQTCATKQREIAAAESDITISADKIAESEDLLKLAFARRDELEQRQVNQRAVQSELMERTSAIERKMKELREERDRLGEKIHQQEIRLNSIESEMNAISDHIRDEYGADIRQIEVSRPVESISDQDARDHVSELKEQLRKFGAVNLLALQEYQTQSEREKFLNEQLADLTAAKNDLQTTIVKINQTARQLFAETFEKARANFKSLFVELFSGGEADIVLEDPSDPLESNISIIARPRGKKLLSITMMSGGERALTAISLLFSLYLVKPSPFCILDEIDAPLDDANCQRFLKIIRKFSAQTQFITITHNKITMEAADNLYGITMEQAGVSKLVAVRFAGGNGDRPDEAVEIQTEVGDLSDAEGGEPEKNHGEELPESIQARLNPGINVTDEPES
jgi:chromosome segregation protein